jgi:hypothetical protein
MGMSKITHLIFTDEDLCSDPVHVRDGDDLEQAVDDYLLDYGGAGNCVVVEISSLKLAKRGKISFEEIK